MTNMTISIPDHIHKIMKNHPDIKWSEIARQGIVQKAATLGVSVPIQDLLKRLPSKTQDTIRAAAIDPKADKNFKSHYKNVKEVEWKRVRSLTRV